MGFFFFKWFELSRFPRLQEKVQDYIAWMDKMFDLLFFRVSEKVVKYSILVMTIIGILLGFYLTSYFSSLDWNVVKKAIKYNREGRYEEVINMLKRYRRSKSPVLHNELGYAYLMSYPQYELILAQKEFKKALSLAPSYKTARYNLGYVYLLKGQAEKAEIEFKEAKQRKGVSTEELFTSERSYTVIFFRILIALLFGFVGYKTPRLFVHFLYKRRVKRLDNQLVDTLTLMANSMKAGLSFLQAVEMVVRETPPPISQELGLVLKEQKLGTPLEQALENFSKRIPLKDVEMIVTAINVLRKTGGNMAEFFETIVTTIRERKRVEKKIKAQTAQGVIQGVILCLLPFALALVLYKIDPNFIAPLFTTVIGWIFIIIGLCLIAMGAFSIKKIVSIEV